MAAKLIVAFNFQEYIEELLLTFKEYPEHYTCQVFIEMILRSKLNEKDSYFLAIREQCSDDDYGKHLKNTISEAIQHGEV